jgi:hypothetical protein
MSVSPEPVGSEVLQLRAKNPAWDGRRLRARLLALGHPLGTVLAAGTITDRLRCHCWLNRTLTQPDRIALLADRGGLGCLSTGS